MPMLALVLALALCQQTPPASPPAEEEEIDWGIGAYQAQQTPPPPAPRLTDQERRDALNRAAMERAAAAGRENSGQAPPSGLAGALATPPRVPARDGLEIAPSPPAKPGANGNCRELSGGGGQVCGTSEEMRRRVEELLRPPD